MAHVIQYAHNSLMLLTLGSLDQSLKSEQNSSHALFCLHSVVLACLPPTNGHKTKANLQHLIVFYQILYGFSYREPSVCVLVLIDDSVNSDFTIAYHKFPRMDVSLAIILFGRYSFLYYLGFLVLEMKKRYN